MKTIIFLLPALILIAGCIGSDMTNSNNAKSLQPVEIKEYQGEKLGSVNDFRENSIKGPQHINISNYHLQIVGLVDSSKEYTYDEVLSFQKYSKVVTLNCVEGC